MSVAESGLDRKEKKGKRKRTSYRILNRWKILYPMLLQMAMQEKKSCS